MKKPAPFTVNVYFLGILGLVPHKKDPSKLAIVVPNADHNQVECHDAPDGQTLHRHRWFLEFDPSQLAAKGSFPGSTRAIWNLSDHGKFHRMRFECPSAPPLNDPDKALNFVSKLSEVAPEYAEIDSRYLDWPSRNNKIPKVAGQIMIDRGRLIPPSTKETVTWSFPSTLRLPMKPEKHYTATLGHQLHLQFKHVPSFSIEVRKNRKSKPELLSFGDTAGRDVEISICNLCDDNPLRWERKGAKANIDDDFRWYFELIPKKKYQGLKKYMTALMLPVPHPSRTNPLGQGQNCLETQYAAQDFAV